ncbi:peroxide stress protein YaaA [Bacterioplanoides sp.]|uniref:peroxide stress protein YaaA n=1 Tax=Bacterioplanoides sp. TaxID=2066072 RepID=UPI003B0072CD
MLTLLSPAKTLDFDTPPTTDTFTQADFLEHSAQLVDVLKPYSPDEIGALMKLSPALSELNVQRYHDWVLPFKADNAKAAMLAFKGDVYTGLEANTFDQSQLEFAQQHVRILSGLYGLLRPLDLIQPYRLEMGTKLENPRGKNLYDFWGDIITDALNAELDKHGSQSIVNLASNEYFKSVKTKKLKGELITPVFKDEKNGQYKIISFYAKKARGLMTAYIVRNNIDNAEAIKAFDVAGYRFSEEDSSGNTWVFKRAEKDIPDA